MIPVFEILHPGLFTSYQDMGRSGFLSYGISHCGVMDKRLAASTNLELGNPISAPLIEFAHLPPKMKVLSATKLAIRGVSCEIRVDDEIRNSPLAVNPGQIISIKMMAGVYGYLGIPGGFFAKEEYGSVSYHALTKIGGGKIEKGDIIKRNEKQSENKTNNSSSLKLPSYESELIRCHRSVEFSIFEEDKMTSFLSSQHEVLGESNRMGIQLRPLNPLVHQKSIISSPVLPGTIQLPPSGNIIVLGNDGQSIGGYPRIAMVAKNDMAVLAQKRPGEKIRFVLL